MNEAHSTPAPATRRRFRPVHLLVLAALLGALAYWPGLQGGYVFDDTPNIINNTSLHVTEPRIESWLEAAWSSPSSALRRPLASLSFALNHYFTGLDPRPMKVTNLTIHFANGLLLFLVLRSVVSWRATGPVGALTPSPGRLAPVWIAAITASIWVLHPINVTSVLYVVQRMESLANLFVLCGLGAYVLARTREGWPSRALLWIGFPACLLLGLGAKESAALLPLYVLALELCVFRGKRARRVELLAFYTLFLVLPGVLALALVAPAFLDPAAYAMRDWGLMERLLSQPRALWTYIQLLLVPVPGAFGLYYDHFQVSTGLLSPWTTLPALLALAGLVILSVALIRSQPLVALGLLWFLCAHALTSSIIPLEIAFEHRNYFASGGLLLAVCAALLGSRSIKVHRAGTAALFVLTLVATYSLADRAREWSHPARLSQAEAERNPGSARAVYGYGATLARLGDYDPDSPFTRQALEAFERSAGLPGSSTLSEVGLIMVAARSGLPVQERWWDQLRDKLAAHQVFAQDDTAMATLVGCRVRGYCVIDDSQLLSALMTAVARERPSPAMLYSYAIFAHNVLGEADLALQLARDAAVDSEPQFQLNLVNYLIDLEQLEQARKELDALRARLRPGQLSSGVSAAEARLQSPANGAR